MTDWMAKWGFKIREDPEIPDGYVMVDGTMYPINVRDYRSYTPEELEWRGIKINVSYDHGYEKDSVNAVRMAATAMTEDMSRLEAIAEVIWNGVGSGVDWETIKEYKHEGWFNTQYSDAISAAEKVRNLVRKQDRA